MLRPIFAAYPAVVNRSVPRERSRRPHPAAEERPVTRSSIASMIGALGLCLAGNPATAGPIFVANAGFEDPALTDDGFTNNVIPGWTGTDAGAAFNFGVYNPPASAFPGQAPEGENVAYIERGAIFQTLADALAAGTYTLTVQVGDSLFDPVSPFTVELRAGSSVLASASSPTPSNGTFTLVTLDYTATTADPFLGQLLEIRLIDNDPDKATEPYFDDVRLDFTPAGLAAVPEPASLALVGAGAAGLLGVRLRRRAGRSA
jgi:hypothetical protein